jgi:serine/threonine-protein kinase HipA
MTDLVPSVPSKVKKSSTVLSASVGIPFLALLNRASHFTSALSAFARSVCFALLRRIAARPAVDVLKLLDAGIFNVIAGNADAHSKNFSILYDDDGPRLAPLYDLLATVAYPDLSSKLAMQIGKCAKLPELDDKGWNTFAADAGLGLPLVRRRVAEMSERVILQTNVAAADLVRPGLDDKAQEQFAEMVVDRAERCAHSTRGNGPPTSR